MRRFWLTAVLGIGCALALLSGCGSPKRGDAIGRPLKSTDPRVLNGQKIFYANCSPCHPEGEGGLGPSLNDKPIPGFAIKTQVRRGFGRMPAFGKDKISDEQLKDLVAYIKALRRS